MVAQKKLSTKQRIKAARDWFTSAVRVLASKDKSIPPDKRPLIASVSRLSPIHIGRMVMFFYDPKLKDVLPYYDMFPLIFPVKFSKDGFEGINIHYLPHALRRRLLEALYLHYKNAHLSPRKRLELDYQILKNSSRMSMFKPCYKRYLWGHVRSKIHVVDPAEWDKVALLPLERFEKMNKSQVWTESRKIIGR